MSAKADKLFPYLKEPCHEKLPKNEMYEIIKNVKAMLMHKFGYVAVSNTDNLLISGFVGVITAGIYSNYYLIIGSVRQILEQVVQGVAASLGNLGVTENTQKAEKVFYQMFFIGYWMAGIAGICLLELLNPFVELAFGIRYLFKESIVLILCVNFFIEQIRRPVSIFKESMGLFWYDRYKSVIEAGLNLVISVVLVLNFGVVGVFLGTLCSTMLTTVWIEPYVIYKYYFEKSVGKFFFRYAEYLIVMASIWALTGFICHIWSGNVFFTLVYRIFICLSVPNILLWLIYHTTEEWKKVESILQKIILKIIHNIKGGELH